MIILLQHYKLIFKIVQVKTLNFVKYVLYCPEKYIKRGIAVVEVITHSRAETEEFAQSLAEKISAGTVIAMRGDLGAGKTCFTSGFAKGLGYGGDVNSPTFAIVNEYVGGRLPLYHFDMYRVNDWEDLYSTGYFEYLESGGILIVEWSENIENALPDQIVTVTIETLGDNDRKITVEGLS